MKKLTSILAAVILLFSLCACGAQKKIEPEVEPAAASAPGSHLVILYTNDVHCGVQDNITYKGLAVAKNAIEDAGKQVLLVDCGDMVQGGIEGSLSKGLYIMDIMNELGYTLAIPGNHEFDYSMPGFFALEEKAQFPFVCCNLLDEHGETVCDPYRIIEADGARIAFVGVATPYSMIQSTPKYFMNEAGEYIYSFCQGDSGEELYAAVQKAVDSARAEGVDYVVLLAHLGVGSELIPYRSSDVIEHTSGIDVVLDGHSHTVMEKETVKNVEGKNVILTSTGTKLMYIGCLTIDESGAMTTKLIGPGSVSDVIDGIEEEISQQLDVPTASSDVDLCITDPATGHRMIRVCETNFGDLAADACRASTGADIGLVNGGGIRVDIPAGEISYRSILEARPFNSELCETEISGSTLLDVLEMSAAFLPAEYGGFLQVSGISFTIDVSIDSPVQRDDSGIFTGIEGDRRVSDVKVGGEPLDPDKIYTVASYDNLIKNMGDGYSMFKDCPIIFNDGTPDNQDLINYILNNLGGTVGSEYANPYGDGRITIIGG